MAQKKFSTLLQNPDATEKLAEQVAAHLTPRAAVLLSGPVGAGKTHFARAAISHLLDQEGLLEDIPSPSFTLVQTYQTAALEIWHVDLYRLSSTDELYELGLDEAFETAACLVEWPERLGELCPKDALHLQFDIAGSVARRLTVTATGPHWQGLIATLEKTGM